MKSTDINVDNEYVYFYYNIVKKYSYLGGVGVYVFIHSNNMFSLSK